MSYLLCYETLYLIPDMTHKMKWHCFTWFLEGCSVRGESTRRVILILLRINTFFIFQKNLIGPTFGRWKWVTNWVWKGKKKVLQVTHYHLRNGGFPAVLINKDVAGISDSGPPKVNFWAQRATRKNNACYLAALELQPLPTVSTEELSGCEHTGYWLQIAEMHMKGMISVSPDSGHLPIHRKALNSLTGDIWFSLTIIFWCSD